MTRVLRGYIPLAILAAGCADVTIDPSGGGGEGPASGGGGSTGGAPPGASELSIEVVDERGLPGAFLDVLAHTGSGELTARAVTADDGSAVIEVPVGGLVSVLFDRHNPLLEGEERSIQSVKPPPGREALRFVSYESQPEDEARPAMGPILIDLGPLASDENFFLAASCGRELQLTFPAANQVALESYRGCPGSDVFDIYAHRVLLSGSDITVTGTAVIAGQPFTAGEGAALALDWQPVSFAETVWQLTDTGGSTSAYGSAWWTVEQPYLLIPEPSTEPPIDPLSGTFLQQTVTLPAELQCVSLGLEREADLCMTSQRTVCGPVAPASIDWPLARLAVPVLGASAAEWTQSEGELGDYVEIGATWLARSGGFVTWSLQVATDVSTRPTDLELPEDLLGRFGRADEEASGVFVSNVDVDGVSGFDAVLDSHGAAPLLPGARPLSRESVSQHPCPD